VIKVDGSDHHRLVEHSLGAEFNGWIPDGRILFSSEAAGTSDVYLINADGTRLVKLTGDATHDRHAVWVSPP
jgi:Tol biopolymer transport system component